jgi:hypothetical protein
LPSLPSRIPWSHSGKPALSPREPWILTIIPILWSAYAGSTSHFLSSSENVPPSYLLSILFSSKKGQRCKKTY